MVELALFCQVFLWLVVLGVFLASGQASVFHPALTYLFFHGMVFVIRPLEVHFLGFTSVFDYIGFTPTDGDFVRTLAVSSVALISFVSCCLYAGWSSVKFPAGPAPEFSATEYRALIWTTLILLPYIVASLATTQGGAEASGERAANGVFIQTHSTGWLNDAQLTIGPLLCAWLIITRFNWLNLLPISLYIAYRTYTGWSRWTIVMFFIAVVFAYCWQHRRKWLPLWALLLAIPVGLLFNQLGHNRDLVKDYFTGAQSYEEEHEIRPGMTAEEKRNLKYDTQNFANFDYLCFLVNIIPKRTESYTYGTQYVQLFTEPIPRILWKDKPTGSPISTIDIGAFGNFVGLTFSLAGDGWASGGWIGVLITLSLAGWLQGKAHQWFWRACNRPLPSLFYVTGLSVISFMFRDGGISIFKFLLWTWMPLGVWCLVIWFLKGRWVPGYSERLPAGAQIRMVHKGYEPDRR